MAEKSAHKRSGGISARVMKVMGLFSGVQMLQVLCSAVKYKLVSIWLHATGVGLFGIYNTTVETIAALTDSGLRSTSIREIAQAQHNRSGLDRIVAIVRSWSAVIGIAAALLMVAAAPVLAVSIFGDIRAWWQFAVLSGATLCNSLLSGERAIIQGLSRFRPLAKIAMYSAVAGLVVSVPMFRYWGNDGIIWSFVAYPVVGLAVTLFYRYRAETVYPPSRALLAEGREMVTLGGYMAVALFVGNLAQTIFIAWLNREASTAEVGYYNAGSTLCIRYVGFVIGAVGMEFYPRLSAHIRSRMRVQLFVNHEIVLLMTVIVPLLLLFLMFRGFVVRLFYSSEFLVIIPFMTVALCHTVFRSSSTVISFTMVARGSGRIYLLVESLDSVTGMLLCMVGYRLFGLVGIGWAFILWFLLYLLLVSLVYTRVFGYRLGRGAVTAVLAAICVVGSGALAVSLLHPAIALPALSIGVIIYGLRLKKLLVGKCS